MPIVNYVAVPVNLEPAIKLKLESAATKMGMHRAELLRRMVKYLLNNKEAFQQMIPHGDPPTE